MKSIVEEASSVVKAIEQAWIRSGKPTSFQVKIFEEPKKNFFGITVKLAKIGLFFSEHDVISQKPIRHEIRTKSRMPSEEKTKRDVVHVEREAKKQKERWTQSMMQDVKSWIDHILSIMDLPKSSFSMEARGYYLYIVFRSALLSNSDMERQLFKSLSYLIIQMLRTKYQRRFVGFKTVLKH